MAAKHGFGLRSPSPSGKSSRLLALTLWECVVIALEQADDSTIRPDIDALWANPAWS